MVPVIYRDLGQSVPRNGTTGSNPKVSSEPSGVDAPSIYTQFTYNTKVLIMLIAPTLLAALLPYFAESLARTRSKLIPVRFAGVNSFNSLKND